MNARKSRIQVAKKRDGAIYCPTPLHCNYSFFAALLTDAQKARTNLVILPIEHQTVYAKGCFIHRHQPPTKKIAGPATNFKSQTTTNNFKPSANLAHPAYQKDHTRALLAK